MNWYDRLKEHVGHTLECVRYGSPDSSADICIECLDCNEVIISAEAEDDHRKELI